MYVAIPPKSCMKVKVYPVNQKLLFVHNYCKLKILTVDHHDAKSNDIAHKDNVLPAHRAGEFSWSLFSTVAMLMITAFNFQDDCSYTHNYPHLLVAIINLPCRY